MYVYSIIVWLAPRVGKMNQIMWCDWLPEEARWSHLARSGLPAVSRMKNFLETLVKMAGYWPHSFFCEILDLDFVLVHKHAKKGLGQYPAILTSHLVNNPYILLLSSAFKVVPWSKYYILPLDILHVGVSHRIPCKNKNAVYHLQISTLVPD